MSHPIAPQTDVTRPETWVKYRKNLCDDCRAKCCTLPVEAKLDDLIRMEVIDAFESQEPAKKLAKKLQQAGIIDHFNFKNEIFTLARRANDDCLYLDPTTRRCTIYAKRPRICRTHPAIGPRPGFCPYEQK
jgi:Fe-S-cluster containining protein